jgi:mono/diheme cytochrome c family protein
LSALLLAASQALAQAPAAPAGGIAMPVSRGQALYDTHCIACHDRQVHWRDKKLAVDWASLKGEVRRWQATAGQWWSEPDIVEVTRYLNETIYRFVQTSDVVGQRGPGTR